MFLLKFFDDLIVFTYLGSDLKFIVILDRRVNHVTKILLDSNAVTTVKRTYYLEVEKKGHIVSDFGFSSLKS